MAGFDNEVLYCDNYDFRGVQPVVAQVTAAGKLPIGTGASPAIEVGTLTSPGGSITIGYSNPNITLDVAGGGTAIEQITVDNSTVPGTNPVLPSGGNITITGGQVANANLANVIQTHSLAANSFAVTIQRADSAAAADVTQNGVAHFDSGDFNVAATGFVTLAGGGAGQTITGDSGGALSPTAGNWNILGGPGVTTTGSGSTLTINSVVYTDQPASIAIVSDSGSFATNGAGIILDLPAAPTQGELIEVVCTTANAVAIDAPVGDFIRAGTLITSSGGTLTSTAIGDAAVMRFNTANQTWYCTSLIGTWLVA